MSTKPIQEIQKYLVKEHLDAFIVFSSDDHGSEYIVDHFKGRAFLSGFTGSAGTLVITKDHSYLWTDGRYFLQAEEQLKQTQTILMKMGEPNVPVISKFLLTLKDHPRVAFDFKTATAKSAHALANLGIELVDEPALLDAVWENRPPVISTPVYMIPTEDAGLSAQDKLHALRESMAKNNCDAALISSLDDIAWTLNIRAADIEYNPITYAYLLVGSTNAVLYSDKEKFTEEQLIELKKIGIHLSPYNQVYEDLASCSGTLLVDQNKLNYALDQAIQSKKDIGIFPTTQMKAIKNETEIAHLRACHIEDAVAMIRFMHYLKTNFGKEPMSELQLCEKLLNFRKMSSHFIDLSFETICGWQSNGAIIHYAPTEETNKEVSGNGLLLVDSGAQYYYGTTDITRTFALGTISQKEKHDFTLVLKSHIALGKAIFKKGTCGETLDMLPREIMHQENKDYKHGTGHGVGYLLNVHEGPQRIGPVGMHVPMEVGMLTSNEPGYYVANEYGVRHESLVLCQKHCENEYGTFYSFETMTLVPFDLDGIEVDFLTNEEKEWLNMYHKHIYDVLCPYLKEEEQSYLAFITRKI